jgi:hypothetical protein
MKARITLWHRLPSKIVGIFIYALDAELVIKKLTRSYSKIIHDSTHLKSLPFTQ